MYENDIYKNSRIKVEKHKENHWIGTAYFLLATVDKEIQPI